MNSTAKLPTFVPALLPRNGSGHQFVCYADSCSGVPGAPEETAFAQVNAVVARLDPQPQFICFPGDEILGLCTDEETLRQQWRHWFEEELSWLDRLNIPIYHTTGNHTAYDPLSESVFRDVLAHLPRNGPSGQEGLSYFVLRGDLLLVFVNTLWSELGGEGYLENNWLDRTLEDNATARYKLVLGHHPVHPVNGKPGPHELTVRPKDGQQFWQVLVKHQVLAYICSHLLTYDVQVHEGVLQILTAGAGRARSRLHCLQAALDPQGLRYQVLDTSGKIEVELEWPPAIPPSDSWELFGPGCAATKLSFDKDVASAQQSMIVWGLSGVIGPDPKGAPQTLLSGWDEQMQPAPFWLGLLGRELRLAVLMSPAPGRSPSYWLGPTLTPSESFTLQIAFHQKMGPGGVLWRHNDDCPWSSLTAVSSQGPDQFTWPSQWSIGHDKEGIADRPFRGQALRLAWHVLVPQAGHHID